MKLDGQAGAGEVSGIMQHQDQGKAQPTDLTREVSFPGDLTFDPDALSLQGEYGDELSAYRARKCWIETLETCFLLDRGTDYKIKAVSDATTGSFKISCVFESACGRYAFWRLTNHQAPEAQYLLETAHIPSSDAGVTDMIGAPDLRSALEDQEAAIAEQRLLEKDDPVRAGFLRILKAAMKAFVPPVRP